MRVSPRLPAHSVLQFSPRRPYTCSLCPCLSLWPPLFRPLLFIFSSERKGEWCRVIYQLIPPFSTGGSSLEFLSLHFPLGCFNFWHTPCSFVSLITLFISSISVPRKEVYFPRVTDLFRVRRNKRSPSPPPAIWHVKYSLLFSGQSAEFK